MAVKTLPASMAIFTWMPLYLAMPLYLVLPLRAVPMKITAGLWGCSMMFRDCVCLMCMPVQNHAVNLHLLCIPNNREDFALSRGLPGLAQHISPPRQFIQHFS